MESKLLQLELYFIEKYDILTETEKNIIMQTIKIINDKLEKDNG